DREGAGQPSPARRDETSPQPISGGGARALRPLRSGEGGQTAKGQDNRAPRDEMRPVLSRDRGEAGWGADRQEGRRNSWQTRDETSPQPKSGGGPGGGQTVRG